MTKGTNQCPRQRRLARTEVTFQKNHHTGLDAGRQRLTQALGGRLVRQGKNGNIGAMHDHDSKDFTALKDAIRAAGLTDVKIMVGGAPVTEEFAREIGADAYGTDAASAVDVLLKMVGG